MRNNLIFKNNNEYEKILDQDIFFKYNQATFYNRQNERFDYLNKACKNDPFYEDFFDNKGSIAVLRLEYFSVALIKKEAIKIIKRELAFINVKLKINAEIKPFKFLHTPAFSIAPGSLSNYGENGIVSKLELNEIASSTMFNKTNDCHQDFRKHFLMHEYLFDDALQLNSPHAFWHYLEALLTPIEKKRKIFDIVSSTLLLKYKDDLHWELTKYLYNTISNDHIQATKIQEKRYEFQKYLRENKRLPFDKIESSSQHALVNYLVGEIRNLENNLDHIQAKVHLNRIITDIKAQRNAIVHNGLSDMKRLKSIEDLAPKLITRFRTILIETANKHNDLNFLDVLELLFKESDCLLQK